MSDFPSIPDHIKDNYRERVAAGERWLAIHEQSVKDDVHDIAAWAKAEADAVGEKVSKAKPRKTAEPTPAPVEPEPVVETPAEVVEPAPVVETPAP